MTTVMQATRPRVRQPERFVDKWHGGDAGARGLIESIIRKAENL